MLRRLPPIFFNPSSEKDDSEQNEREKVSYWLEKLHKQEVDRLNKENEKDTLFRMSLGMQTNSSNSISPSENEGGIRTLEEQGKDEHTRNQATKIETDKLITNRLVKSSNRCIITISSIFPFAFFPDTISVEENRVTFVFRQFLTSQSHSVDIKDISNVFIESSFFSASLQIVSRTFVQNDIRIGNLDKKQAIKVRMMIEGLRTLAGHNIDTSNYTVNELLKKIEEIYQGGKNDRSKKEPVINEGQ